MVEERQAVVDLAGLHLLEQAEAVVGDDVARQARPARVHAMADARHRLQIDAPVAGQRRQVLHALLEGEVHHRAQQPVAAADVVVDQRRCHAHLARQADHRDLGDWLLLREGGGALDDGVARQGRRVRRVALRPAAGALDGSGPGGGLRCDFHAVRVTDGRTERHLFDMVSVNH